MKYTKRFFSSSSYLLSILHKDGIKKQFVSPFDEIKKQKFNDPLNEASFSKAKGLIHRYPDRVVLTVTNRCFGYCKFCFRKKNWFDFEGFDLDGAIDYLKRHTRIREVLISGGDPFFLNNAELEKILSEIRSIEHIEVIRIGTRALSTNPMRMDKKTLSLLTKYKPIWIAIHINHPDELTLEFEKIVKDTVDSGIPIVSQTVLLKGINDDSKILKKLFCRLVYLGIKPYYLFGCDAATGNEKFRVSIEKALSVMDSLRGNVSGLCVPTFAFDLPNGGGKIVLEPQKLIKRDNNRYKFVNFEHTEYDYEDI